MKPTEDRPSQHTLFGAPEPARRVRPDADHLGNPRPNGYAAAPGSGPEGETCSTCKHCACREFKSRGRLRRFYKCEVMLRSWTPGRETDITLRSPACRHWEPGEPHATTVRQLRDKTWKA